MFTAARDGQKVETAQTSIGRGTDKQKVACPEDGILFTHEKGWSAASRDNMRQTSNTRCDVRQERRETFTIPFERNVQAE